MLKSKNNLETIIEFFSNDKINTLFLNYLDEGKLVFYLFLISFFSNKYDYKASFDAATDNGDLFSNKKNYQMLLRPNTNEIKANLETNIKKIIICDYRLYLTYSKKHLSLNAYDFKKDLTNFFKNYLNIDNRDLANGLADNPQYLFSELEKYSINPSKYKFDIHDISETNFIGELRKQYYENKNSKTSLSNLFSQIKLESIYKKFSFLTY